MATKILKYTIVLVGEGGVGKTAIATRFTFNYFATEYDSTLDDATRKQCVIDEELALIDLVDPTLQEDYRATNYWYNFLREGEGVVLVYSIKSRTSFEEMRKYHQEVLQIKKQDSFPMVLMANKCELAYDRQVSLAEGEELAKEFGCYFFEASAKTGTNIDEAFYELVREIKRRQKEQHGEPPKPADANHDDVQHSGGCCDRCIVF